MRKGSPDFDVVIVLGGTESTMKRRVAHAVGLFKERKAGAILMSSGGHKPRIEAEMMRDIAVASKISDKSIILETQSRSTWENALNCAPIIKERGWKAALVVTDTLHLPRAVVAFRAAGIKVTGSAVRAGWREEPILTATYYLAHEAIGLIWYILRAMLPRERQ